MPSAPGQAQVAPVRFVDREARAFADRTLDFASDLMAGLVVTRDDALSADRAENAGDLADRIGDVISQLVVAQSRYRARAAVAR